MMHLWTQTEAGWFDKKTFFTFTCLRNAQYCVFFGNMRQALLTRESSAGLLFGPT